MLQRPPGKIEFVRAEIGSEPALVFVSAADGTAGGVHKACAILRNAPGTALSDVELTTGLADNALGASFANIVGASGHRGTGGCLNRAFLGTGHDEHAGPAGRRPCVTTRLRQNVICVSISDTVTATFHFGSVREVPAIAEPSSGAVRVA